MSCKWRENVLKFLAPKTYLGSTHCDFQIEQFIYKMKSDGIYIINLKKLLRAAHAIVTSDVSVISSRNTGQQAVLKLLPPLELHLLQAETLASFKKQIQAAFWKL